MNDNLKTNDNINKTFNPYYIDEPQVDLKVLLMSLLQPLIKHIKLIIVIMLIISGLGVYFSYHQVPNYVVQYYIQNGVRSFANNNIIPSINFEILDAWVKSKVYLFNPVFADVSKHYDVSAKMPSNTELIIFSTHADDIIDARNYLEKLVGLIKIQPVFAQRIELNKQNQIERIKSVQTRIERERIKLLDHQNRIKVLKNENDYLKSRLNFFNARKEFKEQNLTILRRQQSIIKTMELQRNIDDNQNKLNGVLLNILNLKKDIENNNIQIERLEKNVMQDIQLNISLLEEELNRYQMQLDRIGIFKELEEPFSFRANEENRISFRNRYIILSAVVAVVISYIIEFKSFIDLSYPNSNNNKSENNKNDSSNNSKNSNNFKKPKKPEDLENSENQKSEDFSESNNIEIKGA